MPQVVQLQAQNQALQAIAWDPGFSSRAWWDLYTI